jgi:uncharacterized protein (UPF0276 family)
MSTKCRKGWAAAISSKTPSSYVGFKGSTMGEVEFLTALVRQTGCGLLCDVSNIHVSSRNMAYDALAYVDGLPADAIGEFHLGGFEVEADLSAGGEVIVDTHSRPIDDAAWDLYAHVLRRIGRKPTLIEWDNDLPPLASLIAEAARADAIAATTFDEPRRAAAG